MKIALFGGSFDPPHKGHDAVVKEALHSLDIDKLIIMPSFLSPFKKGFFADEKHRFAWVKKLWGNLEKIEISDYEIQQKKTVASFETAKYLYNIYQPSKFYLIIGADHLKTLHLWQEFEKLNSLVEFVIAHRNGIAIPKNFKDLNTKINICSSFLRTNLDSKDICEEITDEVRKYYTNLQKKNTISQLQRKNMQERIHTIVQILDEKKAEEIKTFDMSGQDYFVEYVIIATILGEKHGLALIDELKTRLKTKGEEFLNIQTGNEWSVLDLGDILIHLISSEYRKLYNIEELLQNLKNLQNS